MAERDRTTKSVGLVPKNGNDRVYTPDRLAARVIRHFAKQINGKILEPCAGKGAFVRALRTHGFDPVELELDRGADFFDYTDKVDWIITNPPWSKARAFARHSFAIAQDVVFLITLNHFVALRARFRDMQEFGFMIKEIALVDTPPPPWPQSGFQLGAIHFRKGWKGDSGFTYL